MTASNKTAGRERPNTPREGRDTLPRDRTDSGDQHDYVSPSAGAHAANHLINDDATPGSGALPSHSHRSGKEVHGGAG